MPLTELETRFRRRNDKCEVMDESLRLTSYSFQSPKQAQKICKNFRELFTNRGRTSSKMVIPLLHCQHIKKNGTLSQQSTYVIKTVYACLSVVRCFRYFIEMANGIDNFFANAILRTEHLLNIRGCTTLRTLTLFVKLCHVKLNSSPRVLKRT